MPAGGETAPRVRRAASESLQRRKPRWGDVGWCRVPELSRNRTRRQPWDDPEDRPRGFNVRLRLYFQWLVRSKNDTSHNLHASSRSYLNRMSKLISGDLTSP